MDEPSGAQFPAAAFVVAVTVWSVIFVAASTVTWVTIFNYEKRHRHTLAPLGSILQFLIVVVSICGFVFTFGWLADLTQ